MSAMICVQYGPITIAVRSITRTPANGPLGMVGLMGGHAEAVPDVVVVPVRQDRKNQRRLDVSNRVEMPPPVVDCQGGTIPPGFCGDAPPGHPARQRDEH